MTMAMVRDCVAVIISLGVRQNTFEYTYYLRSTVFGGQIISEIPGNGQKSMGYVYYPNGELIAVQKLATPEDVAAYVVWQHEEPSGLSVRATDVNGSANGAIQERFNAELDPTRGRCKLWKIPASCNLTSRTKTVLHFPAMAVFCNHFRVALFIEFRYPIAAGCSRISMSLT